MPLGTSTISEWGYRWYGINVPDLMEVPGIETLAWVLLPPRESGYIVSRGPNIDDMFIFWHIDKDRAEGIDFVLKRKYPEIRTETLKHPPKEFKRG